MVSKEKCPCDECERKQKDYCCSYRDCSKWNTWVFRAWKEIQSVYKDVLRDRRKK